jgi:cytoskeletal protein CcmA (bactofilin family)
MALFGREREGMEDGMTSVAAAPTGVTIVERRRSEPTAEGGTSAFLGKGCRINGKVTLEGVARIEGHIEGEVIGEGTLIVGEGAEVKAKVRGASIIVHGHVVGDVVARERVEIRATGSITGNVTTPSLVMHEGGLLEGQCNMSKGSKDRSSTALPSPAASA